MAAKRKWKKGLLVLVGVLGLIYLWQFQLVNYGLMQLRGQLKVVYGAESLEDFLQDPETSDVAKAKIELVLEIRDFSFNELGIDFSENYTTVFDQKDEPSMWVVSACDPFSFTPRIWKFPMLGGFPYKGFFNREKAIEEAQKIKKNENLDVRVRTAGGWSTLGWFKDPILSNMLKRSEGDLASLLIHELTHGTLFVKDSVAFNENLASFIGDKGAVMFMEHKYGRNSPEVVAYKNKMTDEEIYINYALESAFRLDSLYKEITDRSLDEKKLAKEAMYDNIKINFTKLEFLSNRYEGFFENLQPNNTYFMSFLRYNSQLDELEEEFQRNFQGDIKLFLVHLKESYPSL
jgi:predicted aminopeptidase